jgi:uncharacterized protein (TIGR03086 family)
MEVTTACQQTAGIVSGLLANVRADQLGARTPCTDWDVKSLTGHLIGGANMFSGMLGGESGAAPEGDLSGAQLAAACDQAAGRLASAASAEGALDATVSLGPMKLPGSAALALATADHLTHAWDLAKATGQRLDVPDGLAEFALASWQQMIQPPMRDGRMFGAEQPAGEGASPMDRVAAFTGRSV